MSPVVLLLFLVVVMFAVGWASRAWAASEPVTCEFCCLTAVDDGRCDRHIGAVLPGVPNQRCAP